MMMMISKSCIEGCLDAQSPEPVDKRYVKLCQWAQEDKEFLMRMLSMNKQDEGETSSSSSSSSSPLGLPRPPTNLHESSACRQKYLRSYTFTQKQTAAQRTKKWLNEKKKKKKKKNNYLIKPNNNNNNPKVKEVSASGFSCSFIDAFLKFMFVCVAKVDVHEN